MMKPILLTNIYRLWALVIAALFLTTCELEIPDSFILPPNLPYASITGEDGGELQNLKFTLTWQRADGMLSAKPVYDEEVTADAIEAVYNEWQRFEKLIDPRPHFKPAEDADVKDDLDLVCWVFQGGGGGWVLNNENEPIVINRYWLPSLIESEEDLTQAAWLESREDREEAFKQAVKDIRTMQAAIAKSPLYEFEVNGEPLLDMLHGRMETLIAFPEDLENPLIYDNRPRWAITDFDTSEGETKFIYAENQTGPLYEYFFGYVPIETDYYKSDGPKAFPVE
jgi:hypothetical protein